MKTNVIYVADTSSMQYRPGPVMRTWKRQFRAACRTLAPPAGPRWFRLTWWWVATPTGLFANFFLWFAGTGFFGPRFFVLWLLVSLFVPAAAIYRKTLPEPEKER